MNPLEWAYSLYCSFNAHYTYSVYVGALHPISESKRIILNYKCNVLHYISKSAWC